MKAVKVMCGFCGSTYGWETKHSWWLFFDRCYRCQPGERINDTPVPWDETDFEQWLTQSERTDQRQESS